MATGKYKNLNNKEYWEQRSLEQAQEKWNNIKKIEVELKKHYSLARKEIEDDLLAFYQRYADENGLTLLQAQQRLTSAEIGDYQRKMATLQARLQQDNSPFVQDEIERLTRLGVQQRLTALLAQLDMQLTLLGQSQQLTMFDWLFDVYESNYYKNAYDLVQGIGVGFNFTKLDEKAITQAITYPWSGAMFSERIWNNRRQLVIKMQQIITKGLINGSSVQKMSRQLNKEMESSYKNALRLIRTETAEVLTRSTFDSYQEYGVQEYRFIATLDGKTSSACRNQDGKVYEVDKRQTGINAPPMHPNCRSTVAPYFDDFELIGRRAKVDGQSVIVEPNMTYKEFKSRYLD